MPKFLHQATFLLTWWSCHINCLFIKYFQWMKKVCVQMCCMCLPRIIHSVPVFFMFYCGLVLVDLAHILQDHKWRHNERYGVSNHRRIDCLPNRLYRCRSKKASKPRVTGHCEGNSPVTGEFPAQRASNAENVSIWWRHRDFPGAEQYMRLSQCQWFNLEEHE